MKKAVIIGLSLIFTLIICAVVAPLLIDLNKYKGKIIGIAKPYLSRELDFDKIELTVFKGLGAEIQGLRIAENPEFGKGNFLNLEHLRVKIKLLPLLKKQIQVKELILDKPMVRLVKNSKGEFNFNDFTKGSKTTERTDTGSAKGKESENKGKTGNALFAGFMVSQFTLHQGQIDFVDEFTQQGATTTTIDLLDLKFTDVSLNNPIHMFMAARLPGGTNQNLMIKGTIGPVGNTLDVKRLSVDVALSLQEFNLNKYKSFLPKGVPLSPVDGGIGMDISLKGDMVSGITSEGQMQCKDLALTGGDDKKDLGKMQVSLREKMKLGLEKGTVDINRLDLSMNENTVSLSGRVEGFKTKPQWDITLRAQGISTDYVFAFYPSIKKILPKDVAFSGSLGMDVISKGNIDNLQANGNIEMKDLEILYGKIFCKPKHIPCQISVKTSKTGDNIQLAPFSINLHTLSLTASGEIIGLSNPHFDLLIGTNDISCQGWESLVPALKEYGLDGNFVLRSSLKGTLSDAAVNLQFSSPKLSFNASQSTEHSPEAASTKSLFESMDMKVQAEKKDNDIRGRGNLEIKKGGYQTAAFEGLRTQFDYQNNTLGIQGFQVHALQGDIAMNGTVGLQKFSWNVKPVVTNINMAEAIDNFTQYKGLFKGIFSGSFTASSPGGSARKTIDAVGSFRLDQGEIMNLNLVDSLLSTLFGLKGISAFLEKEGEKLGKQKSTQFDYLDSDFSMASNKLNLKKFFLHNIHTAEANGSDAFMEGLVAWDTGGLDLKGKAVLSPEYSTKLISKAEPLNALLNPDNRIVLPIVIVGNLTMPKPIVDVPYVTSAMAKYYSKKELEKLGDKLGVTKKGDKDQQNQELPVGKILKELFK